MSDYSFVEVVISGDSHLVISADRRAYDRIIGGLKGPLDERVTDKYKESFIQRVNEADESWFPARIVYGQEAPLYYVKASKQGNNMVKLTFVWLDELLASHYELGRQNASYRAQLDLYEDVYFEYDPETEVVNVFNTDAAKFDSGLYTIDEFQDLLCEGIPAKSQKTVRGFIGQMKTKTGRFSARVDANVLNGETGYNVSQMEGAYVFYYQGKESVVGHIHLGNGRGKMVAASIKHDSLTGLVDKADITRIAQERIDDRNLAGTTLAIIDIDFFKNVNDTFGHQYGDTVIRRVADIINTEVGSSGIAGRIGGDEFLIVFYNIEDEESLREHLRRIRDVVKESFSEKSIDGKNQITLSIGTATFPKDAASYEDVFMLADYCLYVAKDKGRNRYVIYTPEKHGSFEQIKEKTMSTRKIGDRGDISYGDILLNMFDITLHGTGAPYETFMDEFALAFGLQKISLFVGPPFEHRYSAGNDPVYKDRPLDMMKGFLNSEAKEKFMAGRDFVVINKIDHLPPQAEAFRMHLKDLGVLSFIIMRFYDLDHRECVLLMSSLGKYIQWNETHFKYYRAFTDVLACYHLEK